LTGGFPGIFFDEQGHITGKNRQNVGGPKGIDPVKVEISTTKIGEENFGVDFCPVQMSI
jgi:hypothetical protein